MKKLYAIVLFFFALAAKAQIINIPDANFKARLLLANNLNYIAQNAAGSSIWVDSNHDGEIQVSEAQQVGSLTIQYQNIFDITGIEYFTNLTYLDCSFNHIYPFNISTLVNLKTFNCNYNTLLTFDATNFPNLTELHCAFTQLGSLNVNGLANLKVLNCGHNDLANLDVSTLTNLTELRLGNNHLTTIDLTNLGNLKQLSLNNNQFQSVNVSNLVQLEELNVSGNQLTAIDLTHQSGLLNFGCDNNQLTALDLSASASSLTDLGCEGNLFTAIDLSPFEHLAYLFCKNNPQLATLNIKNGSVETHLSLEGNPNLHYICADENELTQVTEAIALNGYDCHVNTYCSFVPGGKSYTIQGNNRYDINGDGCGVDDISAKGLLFAVSNASTTTGFLYLSGQYRIPVSAGSYTLTPKFENPEYFDVSPSTATVTFPGTSSPYNQDFCVTPNGNHPDLEIMILPLSGARPGVDCKYKILYKNKGNQIQSGNIALAFNDAVLDFVSASPNFSSQVMNYLNWSFADLQPFESRQIEMTLNANSPVEMPPVNGGFILDFTTSINGGIDELPIDNNFVLHQTVVNSLDPNDKTCLEGNKITPEMVGKDVHYVIRFENTGTAEAINIVVKDMIDTDKFDLSSLVPMDGSHPFATKISGNRIEFIFENINLPFDDAHNDGYLMFKIKTKPSLGLGDTFSNTASIYFDYNTPIVTNTATTTIATLARKDFEFSDHFRIWPNPAKDVLNIESKNDLEVTSISIYNVLGQLLEVVPNAQQVSKVDVSHLKPGNYFIKVNSDKGTSTTQFIKI